MSRAEPSNPNPLPGPINWPGQPYYEVEMPCLMGLIVDGLIPPSSPEALERVAYRQGEHESVLAYKMLIASAITVLEQVKDADGVFGAYGAGVVIDQLKDAGFRGAQVLLGDYPRRNPHPPAASLSIVRRPNGALGFA